VRGKRIAFIATPATEFGFFAKFNSVLTLKEDSKFVFVARVRVARIRQELTLFGWRGLPTGSSPVEQVDHFANPDFLW